MQTKSQVCPRCQMPKEEWPNEKGFTKGNETYCCEDCANGRDCACTPRSAETKGK